MSEAAGTGPERRSRAFLVVAGMFGVLALAFSIPFTVISFVDEDEALHRLHNVEFTALYGVLLGAALLVAARRPRQHPSAFLVATASGIASTIAGLASGDFISGVWFTAPITVVVLWWLHPARDLLLRPRGFDPVSAVLAVGAAVPAVAFALTQARLQRDGVAADPHWELHHYSGVAASLLALVLCAFAASMRVRGRRIGAWLVGIAALVLGVGSLVLSDHAGSFEGVWAWLAVLWGVAFIVVAEVRDRAPSEVTA